MGSRTQKVLGFMAGLALSLAVTGGAVAADKKAPVADAKAKPAAADPTGSWSWTMQGRDGTPREQTATLKFSAGKLEGTVSGRRGDAAISDASFKDGAIVFTVVREFNDRKITSHYQGKLAGDTIKGTIESDFGGEKRSAEWDAKRAAAPAPAK